MPLFLSAADTCLVPLRKLPLFEGALPSKIYEAMSCARPILLAVEGEAYKLFVQEAEAAIYMEPENANAWASTILELSRSPALCEITGNHGRAFVEARFDRGKLIGEIETQIAKLLHERVSLPIQESIENVIHM